MEEKDQMQEQKANSAVRFSREAILRGGFSIKQCMTAAAEGDASAQDVLGDCYQYGWYVQKDYAAAVMWYEKSAVQGNAAAR